MGIYVNPVNRSFKSYIKSKVYVDKSPIIIELNELYDTTQKFVCMSRARRFGKTMMANLISAYYSKNGNSRDVFEGLKLSHHKGWDTHLNLSLIHI